MKQVSETKNSVTEVSGSTSTPIASASVPTSSEPKGSHGTQFSMTAWPKCSTSSVRKKIIQLIAHEAAMATMATVWLNPLLRLVNSTIRKNARSGGRGMSQVMSSEDIVAPQNYFRLLMGDFWPTSHGQ